MSELNGEFAAFRRRYLIIAVLAVSSFWMVACNEEGAPSTKSSVSSAGLVSGLAVRPSNSTCIAPDQPASSSQLPGISSQRAFPNLVFTWWPVALLQEPGEGNRWFALVHTGYIYTFLNSQSAAQSSPSLDLRTRIAFTAYHEAGLLGMAFDPGYATNRHVYIFYSAPTSVSGMLIESRISRFKMTDGVIDPASESILLVAPKRVDHHNGGHIAFGPDGMLYAALGDDGYGDPYGNAQNLGTLHGKVIRIDVRGEGPYAIPTDNPFVGENSQRCPSGPAVAGRACGEVWAYGFRNPWRWSFDRASATPELWLGDVGHEKWEEVNYVSAGGGNYGWPIREGRHCQDDAESCVDSNNGDSLTDPVAEYGRDLGFSITGGYVYRGKAIPELVGHYVFGDWATGKIFALVPNTDGELEKVEILNTGAYISSFAEDNEGELYYLVWDQGTVYKLVPGEPARNTIRRRLSRTGCVDPLNPTKPATGLIPYAPLAQFWSDGAEKSRWMALPDDTTIDVESDGDWTFPRGTVLMKNFEINGSLVETRLLMRHRDTGNWSGYTYRWNEDHSDALLVRGGADVQIGEHKWRYPSESQCLQCHTGAAGRSLGLETKQLNAEMNYPETGIKANQLVTLEHIGMFTKPPAHQEALPDLEAAFLLVPVRARLWLHANCSQCHRPGGGTPVDLDLRFETAIESTRACKAPPTRRDLGVSGAQIIMPGDASRSVLYLRASRRGSSQMPPIGSHLVDPAGERILRTWIDGMDSSCNWNTDPSPIRFN